MACTINREAVEYILSVLGGKWKWIILILLSANEVMRYGELKRAIPGITHKMLSQQLKGLEAEGMIRRDEYRQVPPKVEYSIAEKGAAVVPILQLMSDWGEKYGFDRRD